MEIIKRNIDELNIALTVKIEKNDYQAEVDSALKTARSRAEIKGFRKGTAPMSLVKKMYESRIQAEEIDKQLSKSLNEYIKDMEGSHRIIGMPVDINVEPLDLTKKSSDFEFQLGLQPDYSFDIETLSLPFYEIAVTEELVDKSVEEVLVKAEKVEQVDIIEAGDLLRADATGTLVDGVEYLDNVMFSLDFISDEAKQSLIGKTIEDSVELNLKASFINEADLASMLSVEKDALANFPETLTFKITEITRRVKASLDQEFFAKFKDERITDEASLREVIREDIAKDFNRLATEAFGEALLKHLFDSLSQDLPDDYLKKLLLNLDETGKTMSDIEATFPEARESIRMDLIRRELIRHYDIGSQVTPELLHAEARSDIERQFRSYGLTDMNMFAGYIDEMASKQLQKKEDRDRIFMNLCLNLFSVYVRDRCVLDKKQVSLDEMKTILDALNNQEQQEEEATEASLIEG